MKDSGLGSWLCLVISGTGERAGVPRVLVVGSRLCEFVVVAMDIRLVV